MKKFDIISIGSSLRDIFLLNKDLKYPKQVIRHPFNSKLLGGKINVKHMYFDIGGGGSNTAATLANMGLKTALLSQVGNDLAGKEVIRVMKKFKVNINLLKIHDQEETGYSVIFIDKTGDKTALVFRGASDFTYFNNLPKNKLNTNWFFITSLNGNIQMLQKIFSLAKKNKIKVAWNPGGAELDLGKNKLKNLLKNTDVLLLNLKEARRLTATKTNNIKKLFGNLRKLNQKGILCITGGKKGAWVEDGNTLVWADIFNLLIVNATGAGDAFGSGFVAGLILYKNNIQKALQLGMLNSNSVVTKMGAKHGLLKKPPTKKMLERVKVKELK